MGITEEQDRNLYSISWKTLPGSIITAHKASPKPLIVSNVSIFFPSQTTNENSIISIILHETMHPVYTYFQMMNIKYWSVDQHCKKRTVNLSKYKSQTLPCMNSSDVIMLNRHLNSVLLYSNGYKKGSDLPHNANR